MLVRFRSALLAACLLAGTAWAQPSVYKVDPLLTPCEVEPPSHLPPLLPVPNCTTPPKRSAGRATRAPVVEYDRSALYLPDAIPPREVIAPAPELDRFWLSRGVKAGWTRNSGVGAGVGGELGYRFGPGRLTAVELTEVYLHDQYFTATAGLRRSLPVFPSLQAEGLLGYRFARVKDDAGRVDFHGLQVGLASRYQFEKWTLSTTTTVSFGETFGPGDSSNPFAVLPTLAVRLERPLFKRARGYVEYDLHYLSRTPGLPEKDFWMQAVRVGAELRF